MANMKYRNGSVGDRVHSWLENGGELNLAECNLTTDDLVQLASDERVTRAARTLRLTGNDADDWLAAMPLLGRFRELNGLLLHGCRLGETEDAVQLLAEGLAACISVRSLGLGFNGLTAEMLTPAFACKTDLEILDLAGNRLDDAFSLSIALRPLTELTYLNLGGTDLSDCDALTECLAGMRYLTHLSLYECVYLDDLTWLLTLLPINGGNLRSVDVRGCELWEHRVAEDAALSERNGLNAVVAVLKSVSVEWDKLPGAMTHA